MSLFDWFGDADVAESPKPTITIVFDDVLCNTSKGQFQSKDWIASPPVPGAMVFLLRLLSEPDIRVMVYDTRSYSKKGRVAMKNWLTHWSASHFLYSIPHNLKTGYADDTAAASQSIQLWINAGYPYHQRLRNTRNGIILPKNEHLRAGRWLTQQVSWPKRRPKARAFIDARAFEFRGRFPSVDELLRMKSWNHEANQR